MINENNIDSLLEERLRSQFPGQLEGSIELQEQCDWSKSYRAAFSAQGVLYIKGTPRSRPVAEITSALHEVCPALVPEVLNADLLPEHPWRWFLLENRGECDHNQITPERAAKAAYHLGRLQRGMCQHVRLAAYLPQCRADGLQKSAVDVCEWMLQTATGAMRNEILAIQARIMRSTSFFRAQQKILARLPNTIVHGDFWSGNIAYREGEVSFIDWGDAFWGVGSISIVNLLASASEDLSDHSEDIWTAYSRGWGIELSADLILASQVAGLVGDLVVDVEIARCCNGTVAMLPGLVPTLQSLDNFLG